MIFVLALTVLYAVYYSVIIMQDLYGKKDNSKHQAEVFDVPDLMDDEQEAPISIKEEKESEDDAQSEDSKNGNIVMVDENSDMSTILQNEKNARSSAKEDCKNLHDMLHEIEVSSTGGMLADEFVDTLINQKPGSPKIFFTRENI